MTKNISNGRGWATDETVDSIHRMDKQYGAPIPITSAGRTYAEQAEAYRKYLAGTGARALPPGTSIHERGMAIDWGSGAWTWLGLRTGNNTGWLGGNANENGHRRTAWDEIWHTEYDIFHDVGLVQTLLNNWGYKLVVDAEIGPATIAALKDFQKNRGLTVDGEFGPASLAALRAAAPAGGIDGGGNIYDQWGGAIWVKAIQNKLNRLGYGPLDEDGIPGPMTEAAVKKFQQAKGLEADGIAGPVTNNALDAALSAPVVGENRTSRQTVEIQKYLIAHGYDLGSFGADGDYGAATTAAVIKWQKDNGLEADGVYGPVSDAKMFPPETTPPATQWPVNGRNATTRPTKDIQAFLISKGFNVGSTGADGVYGPATSIAVAQWQKATGGLDVDGIYGPASDLKMFPGVPLPDQPADPTADPTYGKKIPQYPGATWADVSPNKSVRTGKVQLFIVHHRADTGTPDSARRRFMTANDRNVSPNWNINQDGSVDEIVPPDSYRAWTTGAVDHQAVTVETGNTSGEPNWGISPASHEAIAKLIAWAANRYKFPITPAAVKLDAGGNNVVDTPGVIPHRETPAGKSTGTVCPGPSMNMTWLLTRAKEIYQKEYVEPPVVDPPVDPPVDPIPEKIPAAVQLFLKNLQAELDAASDAIDELLD